MIQIKNVLVLVESEDKGFKLQRTDIFIKDGKIASLGKAPEDFFAEKIIDGTRKLAMPGLVNAHTHSYMTVFRNCADDRSFEDWLFKYIMPLEDKLVPEDAYWGSLLAMIEMIKTGTTCFTDMHMHINQVPKAAVETGIRAVITRGLAGETLADGGQRRLDEAFSEINNWKGEENISFMLAPHAPYSCGKEYLKVIAQMAKENDLGINIHLSESLFEVESAKENFGMTPIEYVDSLGLFENRTVAAHCVNLSENDFNILKEKNVSVATNPASNMKLGNGFAPVAELLKRGINVCLGTDGAASNNSLNMFREMGFLGLIHKGTAKDPLPVSAADCIKAATANGAKAAGLSDKIGKIEAGMDADIILIDMDTPAFNPFNNSISALVYSAGGYEVDTVMVKGKILMEGRILTTIDEEKVYYKVNEIAKRLGIGENL